MPPQQTGRLAVRNGALFGAILGVLGFGNTLIQWVGGAYHLAGPDNTGFPPVSINDTGGISSLGFLVFLAMLALTFVAGILTVRGTRKVGSGAVAGLLTGVFGGLIGGIGSVVVMKVVAPSLEMPSNISLTHPQVETFVVVTVIFVSILVLLVETGIGAGMGALGGIIGAKGYHQALPPAPPSYTTGYPGSPGYSAIPPQPGNQQPPQ